MKICYRGQQVFLKSAESQRKNKTAKRRSKFSQGTRYLPLTFDLKIHEKNDSLIYILYFRKLPLLFLLYSVFLPPTLEGLHRRTYQSSVPENQCTAQIQYSVV